MDKISVPGIGMTFGRDLMPQIDNQNKFLSYLKGKGIDYSKKILSTKDLKSTQSEFDKDKIFSLIFGDDKTNPIIVSNDGYVLDGHHRWIADHNKEGKTECIIVNLPILELMRTAKECSGMIKEDITHKEFGPMLDSFTSFAADELGIKSLPKFRFKDSNENFASFGGYSPGNGEIVLQTKGRHPNDVLRTYAHELVHHFQRENDKIGNDIEKEGEDGSEFENEANAKAGVIMRKWGKKYPEMFEYGALVEEVITEMALAKAPRKTKLKTANRARYKALFYAGGPGSGKDYVAKQTGYGHGLTEINSDHAFEHLLGKAGLSKQMPPEEEARRNPVRGRAKSLTKIRQSSLLSSGRGVIINTTGHDHEKIGKMKAELEKRGYDTKMIFVNTSNDVSRQRNIERGQAGGRTVPEETRQEYWKKAQQAKGKYQKMFGEHFHHVDNSMDVRAASDDEKAAKQGEFTSLFKHVRGWATSKPENPTGRANVESEIAKRRKTPKAEAPAAPVAKPKRTTFGNVSPEVNATAKGLGLKHWGSGYFGPRKKSPDGRPIITHRESGGKLTRVSPKKTPLVPQTVKEDLRNWFNPKHPEGGWKRINSKGEVIGPCARGEGEGKPKCMSNEKRAKLTKKERASAVAAKRKHDPNPERKGSPINVSNFGKGKIEEENKPTNPELWSKAKSLAKQKFDVYPSAYANGWASKWYKSKGGGWKSVNEAFEDYVSEMNNSPIVKETLPQKQFRDHPFMAEGARKKKKMKRKALAQEVYNGKTDTSLNVKGLTDAEGVGPMASLSASPSLIGGLGGVLNPYLGMPSNYTPYYGISESVIAWATKEETINAYVERYGDYAKQKLNEDAKSIIERGMKPKTLGQLKEAWGKDYGLQGTVEKSGYKDDDITKDNGIVGEDSPAWQRKEGKNPEGGLNKKGVESYRRENPGSKLQTAVTTKPSKLKKGSKSWKRRKSFCARMSGVSGPMKDDKGRPTRKALSLRKWNCE